MKTFFTIIALFFSATMMFAQEVYSQTFGNVNDKAIIFLHGGPGYNSVNFEVSTAEELANNGFFVIVYDRRGEGQSQNIAADYTFAQTFEDLNEIYNKYHIEKATLIGHSFGGIIATLFAEKQPEKVQSIFLVSAPVAFQKCLQSVLASVKKIYTEKQDTVNLNYVKMLENMDSASLQYSSYLFMHAMSNKFYSPKEPTEKAQQLYAELRNNTLVQKYGNLSDYKAPMGFWTNENYTTIDLTENIKRLKNNNLNIFGIYGKDDGIIPESQVEDLRELIGNENVLYIENASHNVFIDRQDEFIKWMKSKTEQSVSINN